MFCISYDQVRKGLLSCIALKGSLGMFRNWAMFYSGRATQLPLAFRPYCLTELEVARFHLSNIRSKGLYSHISCF